MPLKAREVIVPKQRQVVKAPQTKLTSTPISTLRPREKALRYGCASLSDAELLALFLRTGAPGVPVLQLASKLLNDYRGWSGVVSAPPQELSTNYLGLGKVKTLELAALNEIARRIARRESAIISSFRTAAHHATATIGSEVNEHFLVLLLNGRNELVHKARLFSGASDALIIEPRTVIGLALRHGATGLYCFHNHPSGSLTPSSADYAVARELTALATVFAIKIFGHGIVNGRGNYKEILL